MKQLVRGLLRFQSEVFPERREHFESLREGQAPTACLIACGDSRVDPSMVLQSQPGDLFVLRNAGNLVPVYPEMVGGTAASVEFAVEVLRVRDLIVCGHSHCGAIRALLDPEQLSHLPALRQWLDYAAPLRGRLAAIHPVNPEERLDLAVKENARLQLSHLDSHPSVRAAVAEGRLRLHAWVYYFEHGEVLTWDADQAEWRTLRDWARDNGLADDADDEGAGRAEKVVRQGHQGKPDGAS
ncbi:MAG: carbonic anhydrase [Candidatus Eisenbacteria bacterium]|nr:carbonic anhydrase [Candidatus Eisenbacteria bacterium]